MQPPQGPYQPNDDSAWSTNPDGSQWTQRPLPGQDVNGPAQSPGQPMPGQVPPPAQIVPDPAQGAYYGMPSGPMLPQDAPGQPYGEQYASPQQPMPRAGVSAPYQPPKTGMPRARRKARRGGSILLVLAVVGFALFAVLRMLSPGQVNYGYVRSDSLTARYTGDAVIVRDETVYTESGVSQVEYDVDEGMQVKRGNNVATIYKAGFSAKEWVTLQNYRNQIKEYHKVLIANSATDIRLITLMSNVKERALEVQQLVHGAQGSLTNQETLLAKAMQAQQIYMKQKYPDDQKLSRLYDDENAQIQKIATWTKQYAALADGVVSFYTDGFENGLNMLNYGDYSPAQVRTMYKGQKPSTGEVASRNTVAVYRLVKEEPWAVLMLCNEMEWTPVTGRTYKLLIESFDNIIVDATVDSFTRSGGELLVRLLIQDPSALPSVLYVRSCHVQLGESVNTLKVPSRAIYIQDGRKGVVMATEGGEYWTGVEVVSDDGNSAYVIPENAGVLYDGVPVRLF